MKNPHNDQPGEDSESRREAPDLVVYRPFHYDSDAGAVLRIPVGRGASRVMRWCVRRQSGKPTIAFDGHILMFTNLTQYR